VQPHAARPAPSTTRRTHQLLVMLVAAAVTTCAVVLASPASAAERDAPSEQRGWLTILTAPPMPSFHVADPCDPAPDAPVPGMVAHIFRCRLADDFSPEQATHVAAEAVVVAECESAFDPDVVVFDGRYVDQPHPATGLRYTAAGVFQFIRWSADHYVEGGYAAVTDPVANINGAVKLYLENRANGGRGWESWECSAVNGAFKGASVLPGWPGGPAELPAWAWAH
jgi:hypothetical protein